MFDRLTAGFVGLSSGVGCMIEACYLGEDQDSVNSEGDGCRRE